MSRLILLDAVGPQLLHGVFSWNFLQFVVLLLSAILFVLTSATVLSFLDRKIIAIMQRRIGPIHTGGPWGILQAIADTLKLLLKEQIVAQASNKLIYVIAPCVFIAPVIGSFAVLPLSPYISIPGTALATGILFTIAMSSIDVLGVFMAGWSSNNKYAIIGSIRGVAQMISYELPLTLSLVSIILLTSVLAPDNSGIGTLAFREIMTFQATWNTTHIVILDFIFEGFTPWSWFILVQPLMLVIYYICGLAETNRVPFDLAEAESELVAGHLTEYSGVRWAMFFLGEYGNMTIVTAIITYLFLGGWSGPGVVYLTALNIPIWGLLGNLLGVAYFVIKVYGLCFFFIWARGTLPRLRPDQLMRFAWLILMPITLLNILVTAFIYLLTSQFGLPNWSYLIILGIVNWIALIGFVQLIGQITKSSTHRAQAPAIRARLRLAQPTLAQPAKEERLLHTNA